MERVNETTTAIGYCNVLTFEGERPSWDAILRYVHGVGDAPSNLVRHVEYKNRLNQRAVAASAGFWVDRYVKTPSRIKLGTGVPPAGTTGPLATDEDCWTPDNATLKECDVKTTFLSIYSEYGVTYETGEFNGTTYTEALLTDEDGNAWAHAVVNLTKTSTQQAVCLWKIAHSAL
jgi:hypothetical protein